MLGRALEHANHRNLRACCERTASGHAATTPPASVMNSRRLERPLRTKVARIRYHKPSCASQQSQPGSVLVSWSAIRNPRRTVRKRLLRRSKPKFEFIVLAVSLSVGAAFAPVDISGRMVGRPARYPALGKYSARDRRRRGRPLPRGFRTPSVAWRAAARSACRCLDWVVCHEHIARKGGVELYRR
jgi:hypothetical protein